MPTPEEIEDLARQNCPYCRAGKAVRQLEQTGEYVHDIKNGASQGVALCLSNGLRGGPHLSRM